MPVNKFKVSCSPKGGVEALSSQHMNAGFLLTSPGVPAQVYMLHAKVKLV